MTQLRPADELAMLDQIQQAPDMRSLILSILKANDEQAELEAKRHQDNLRAWAEETG
jgi:hypothetical protein